jgi:serine protease
LLLAKILLCAKAKNLAMHRYKFFCLLICLLARTVPAAVIYVPADQPTIQQAIDISNDGDVIFVSPGLYNEDIDYHGKAITVRSVAGPTQTIIEGINPGSVVTFQTGEGPQSVLNGFTIQGGNAEVGGGLYLLAASPTITHNIFRDNNQQAGGYGAAIGGNVSSSVIEDNTFENNTCDSQYFSGVVAIVNDSSPIIINNVFRQNPCRAINIPGSHPVVANNTIISNTVGIHVDARAPTYSHFYANNIIVGNGVGLEVDLLMPGNEPRWKNNLVFDNATNYSGIADQTGLNGNISADPQFVSGRDVRLQSTSPAIDAGAFPVPNLPRTDIVGSPRVVDGNSDGFALPDIGAFEFIP